MMATQIVLLHSRDKPQLTKPKDSLREKSIQEEGKVSLALRKERNLLRSSLMILICLKKRYMVPNLQSKF